MSNTTTNARPRRKPKRLRAPGAGRPELPPHIRKRSLTVRLPQSIIDGFASRAASRGLTPHGTPASSIATEIERAYELTIFTSFV